MTNSSTYTTPAPTPSPAPRTVVTVVCGSRLVTQVQIVTLVKGAESTLGFGATA